MSSISYYKKYGDPTKEKNMIVWVVPNHLRVGVIPKKIYCNKDFVKQLEKAFVNLIDRGFIKELKTWDGCFNIRPIRGYEDQYKEAIKAKNYELASKYLSVHSWGMAIDVNRAENGLGQKPKLSLGFVKCFTDVGFTWGGTFKRSDGMHFEIAV